MKEWQVPLQRGVVDRRDSSKGVRAEEEIYIWGRRVQAFSGEALSAYLGDGLVTGNMQYA